MGSKELERAVQETVMLITCLGAHIKRLLLVGA